MGLTEVLKLEGSRLAVNGKKKRVSKAGDMNKDHDVSFLANLRDVHLKNILGVANRKSPAIFVCSSF